MKKINMASGKAFAALAVLAAAFTMASCSREQLVEPEVTPVVGNDIITAFTESTLTKTSLDGDDTEGYDVVWSEGDQIKIGGNTFTLTEGANTTTGKFQGTLPTEDGTYTACYPATYNGTDWPNEQTYTEGNITGSPMTADVTVSGGKVSGPLSFKNAGGILRLTVKGTAKVKSITVSATNLLNDITLNCGNGVTLNEDGTVFHIAMPAGSYSKTSIQFTSAGGSSCTKTLKSSALVMESSKITPASFSTSFITTGSAEPLPGEFSVANGRQVSFSQGNLICDISDETQAKWGFYENQYGYATGYSSTLISLFTWGYDPIWSIVANGTKNPTNENMGGSNYLPQDKDWGSRFGDGNTWRTLTMEEWKYLFETRTNATDKYGYATVGGVHGIIILPDIFTDPLKNGGSGAFAPKSTTGWNANVYTTGGDWEAMEAAGAVFLPAAGSRSGLDLSYVGSSGLYWSSSYNTTQGPYGIYFDSSLVDPDASGSVTTGKSVRLVKDICAVTFDLNGKNGTAPESIRQIHVGSTVTKPSAPTGINYEFTGWYKEPACINEWNFDTDVVTENITLYAGWSELPVGTLPGKFSVSPDKQVHFSKGNLYCKISASGTSISYEFAFEKEQYNFHSRPIDSSEVPGLIAGWYASGLFQWVRRDATNYSVAELESYGAFSNLTDDKCKGQKTDVVDFGEAMGEPWTSLTDAEWIYLLGDDGHPDNPCRTNAKSLRTFNTVAGVYGVIIAPDGWTGEFQSDYCYADWVAYAEPQGLVFLPAAGFMDGQTREVSFGGKKSHTFYWANNAIGESSANSINLSSDEHIYSWSQSRSDACAVRLVTAVTE